MIKQNVFFVEIVKLRRDARLDFVCQYVPFIDQNGEVVTDLRRMRFDPVERLGRIRIDPDQVDSFGCIYGFLLAVYKDPYDQSGIGTYTLSGCSSALSVVIL